MTGPRAALAALLALLALLAPASFASADHVYTHRYYVLGRVIDAAGEPVANANVTADLPGVAAGPCVGSNADARAFRATRTSPEGDFLVCFHAHGFPGGQTVVVTAGGETVIVPADPELRKTVVLHRLANASALKDAGGVQFFPYRYSVVGRLWNASGPVLLENVKGNGTPLAHVEVTATLTAAGSERVARTVTSDAWGDYAISFQVGKPIREGTVRVAIAEADASAPLDAHFRKSVVNLIIAPAASAEAAVAETERIAPPDFAPPTGELPPGSTPAPGAFLALAAVAALAIGLGRRK